MHAQSTHGQSSRDVAGVGARPAYTRRRPEETALWGTVRTELPAFEATWRDDAEGRELPAFVRGEFAGFLDCGILGRGFGHIRCGDCGSSRLVAFSCKARGLRPSCLGRRMCEGAAPLVDQVLPEVPLRQWVLTQPFPVRYRLAPFCDGRTLAGVLRLFRDTVARDYRRRLETLEVEGGLCGGVTAIRARRPTCG